MTGEFIGQAILWLIAAVITSQTGMEVPPVVFVEPVVVG